jgi:hypothetical protein
VKRPVTYIVGGIVVAIVAIYLALVFIPRDEVKPDGDEPTISIETTIPP